jgi:hypothetical protein
MASLHTKNQEISGRKIWTGSLSLAHTLLSLPDDEKRIIFESKRYMINLVKNYHIYENQAHHQNLP